MKKKAHFLISIVILLSLVLVACSSKNNSSNSTGNTAADGSNNSAALSPVNKLLVGPLKLEETDQAVTADEAAQLLPLWQAYRSLSNSQTAAEAEVDGLVKQIEATMNSTQLSTIDAMNLTNNDLLQLMQSMGGPQGTPNPQATPGAGFPSGNIAGGNFPQGMEPPSLSGGGTTGGNRPSGGGAISGGGPVIIQGGSGMGGDVAGVTGGQILQGTPNPTQQARFITQATQANMVLLNVLIDKLQAITPE
jgi:hypothetical protein